MRLMRWLVATKARRIVTVIAGLLLVPVLVLAWWLGSPLFLDEVVDESFPLSANAVLPEGMSQQEAERIMAGEAEVETVVDESMDMMQSAEPSTAEPVRVKSGSFQDADSFHKGSGQATVYELPDGSHVLRFEDFMVTNGPDLRVLLSGHAGPMSRDELTDAGYIEIGELKGNIGNQNYELPADVDIASYRSVIIYCKPFHVLFSIAPILDADGS